MISSQLGVPIMKKDCEIMGITSESSGAEEGDLLKRRRIINKEKCLVCGGHSESVEHVVRDCPLTVAVWFAALGLHVHQVHELSLKAWVSRTALTLPPQGFELLLMVFWSLWKVQNDLIWRGVKSALREVVLRADELMVAFQQFINNQRYRGPVTDKNGVLHPWSG
ncbi:hypothetical protein ACFX13_048100 [Malus domestica]